MVTERRNFYMEERKYLKWYNKVGYGSGDIAGNVVYAFLTSFVMIYLTDTIGLNAGIVGTLIAVSKLFDGVSDIFFGSMIVRTKSKMGKARPWMFYGFFGCAVTLFGVFAIPTSLGKTAQYAWFFIAYTLLNAVFYTANNIAYAALTSLVTKNAKAPQPDSQDTHDRGRIRRVCGKALCLQHEPSRVYPASHNRGSYTPHHNRFPRQ